MLDFDQEIVEEIQGENQYSFPRNVLFRLDIKLSIRSEASK